MKNRTMYTLGVALFISLGILSCAYDLYEETRAKPATGSQHEFLASLKATGEYIVGKEKLENMITDLINPKSEARSVVASKKVKITGSKKLPLPKSKTSLARSAATEGQVDVYVFTTENTDGVAGYILASPDMRIGNILAVVDGKTLEDEPEWFTDIIFDGLAAYIELTIQEYESIDDAEIQATLENSDSRSVAPPYNFTPGSGLYNPSVGWGGLIHHWYPNAARVVRAGWSWYLDEEYSAFVPVNWHQHNPYNYYVARAKNGTMADYRTGCAPVAVAQIAAYHRWPEKCAMNVTIPNVNMNIKDYVYNWSNMIADFGEISETDEITGGAKDIAVLMYHIARGVGLTEGSTIATWNDVVSAFSKLRFWTGGGFISYDLNKIRSSIAAGNPVVAYGAKDILASEGHFWVIDGVRPMSYGEILSDGAEWRWVGRNFVHCNAGWRDGSIEECDLNIGYNAWYISELFDFNWGHHALARSSQGSYYPYVLKIFPNLYPVK